jgi:predicted nucleic acid-binding protein
VTEIAAITKLSVLGLDTSPLIYYIEKHPQFYKSAAVIFNQIESGKMRGVTSALTLTEVLVHPLAKANQELADSYRDILANSANFSLVSIDSYIAEVAASLRARYRLRTPDAIQIAVALRTGCEAFLTNDQDLKRVTEINVVILSELEP